VAIPEEHRQKRCAAYHGRERVSNLIELKPVRSRPKSKTRSSRRSSATRDANRIHIEANGSEVILKGTVRSWIEREEAERVAWSGAGVARVEDRIVVVP
jgi:osmotically-inducible protein OsmY